MNKIYVILMLFISVMISEVSAQHKFYDFKVETITGDSISLSQFKGKKILVVNTASKCGFTPQYEDLETLYETYKDQDFVILGFPANNFLHQEPGSNEDIATFCKMNYGVTFPMMAKISVKGKDIHPLYEWLTTKKENGVLDTKISWNFQKFLIDKNGILVKTLSPKTKPMDEEIVDWIKSS
jgi:glutathione peroxidase